MLRSQYGRKTHPRPQSAEILRITRSHNVRVRKISADPYTASAHPRPRTDVRKRLTTLRTSVYGRPQIGADAWSQCIRNPQNMPILRRGCSADAFQKNLIFCGLRIRKNLKQLGGPRQNFIEKIFFEVFYVFCVRLFR